MTRDYSLPDDPYGISEYTSQSADTDIEEKPKPTAGEVRGNTVLMPRSVPTQAEADAVRDGS